MENDKKFLIILTIILILIIIILFFGFFLIKFDKKIKDESDDNFTSSPQFLIPYQYYYPLYNRFPPFWRRRQYYFRKRFNGPRKYKK